MNGGFLPYPSVSLLGIGGLSVIVTPNLERVLSSEPSLVLNFPVTGHELNPVVRAPEYQGLQRLLPSLIRCLV